MNLEDFITEKALEVLQTNPILNPAEIEKSIYNEFENIAPVKNKIITKNNNAFGVLQSNKKSKEYFINQQHEFNMWDSDKLKYKVFGGSTKFAKIFMSARNKPRPTLVEICKFDTKKVDYMTLGRITALIDYIDKNNCLVKQTRLGLVCVSIHDIADIIDLCLKRTRAFIKLMDVKGIIRLDVNGHYYMNPLYVLRDVGISLDLYKLFKDTLDLYLSDQAKVDIENLTGFFHNKEHTKTIEEIIIERYVAADRQKICNKLVEKEWVCANIFNEVEMEERDFALSDHQYRFNILSNFFKQQTPNLPQWVKAAYIKIAAEEVTPKLFNFLFKNLQRCCAEEENQILTLDQLIIETFGLIQERPAMDDIFAEINQ